MWGDCYCYYYVGRWRIIILRGELLCKFEEFPGDLRVVIIIWSTIRKKGRLWGKSVVGGEQGTDVKGRRREADDGWWVEECLEGWVFKSDQRSLRRLLLRLHLKLCVLLVDSSPKMSSGGEFLQSPLKRSTRREVSLNSYVGNSSNAFLFLKISLI